VVIAALIASSIGGAFLLWTQVTSPFAMVTDFWFNVFVIYAIRIVYSIIVPLFATLFGWFGISARQMG
jgi:hypothetical protein